MGSLGLNAARLLVDAVRDGPDMIHTDPVTTRNTY